MAPVRIQRWAWDATAARIAARETDAARLIRELEDARHWAEDVERRLAEARPARGLGRRFAGQVVRGRAARARGIGRRQQS
jgi:hypothetical protein